MAIMLTEIFDADIITEESAAGKKVIIEGIFMQSEIGNRNGRLYPRSIMEREVNKYNKDYVDTKRSMGELNHPLNRVSVDPREASHLITKLEMVNNDVKGKATILETPMGRIVKALVQEGIRFGVSSRALGSLKQRADGLKIVGEDFALKTIDIVSDPSSPDAFVNGLMENKEWVMVNGIWTEQHMEQIQNIIRKATAKELNEVILKQFNLFIKTL